MGNHQYTVLHQPATAVWVNVSTTTELHNAYDELRAPCFEYVDGDLAKICEGTRVRLFAVAYGGVFYNTRRIATVVPDGVRGFDTPSRDWEEFWYRRIYYGKIHCLVRTKMHQELLKIMDDILVCPGPHMPTPSQSRARLELQDMRRGLAVGDDAHLYFLNQTLRHAGILTEQGYSNVIIDSVSLRRALKVMAQQGIFQSMHASERIQ